MTAVALIGALALAEEPAPPSLDREAPFIDAASDQSGIGDAFSAPHPELLPSSPNTRCYTDACETSSSSRRRGALGRYWLNRVKPRLQRSHWGYCNRFEERQFGDAFVAATRGQIDRGSADLLMLYHYDFYPRTTQRGWHLTPRGRYQLRRMVQRVIFPRAPIKIQITYNDPKLDAARHHHVIQELKGLGIEISDDQVILARQKHAMSAAEATELNNGLLEIIKSRGRTVTPETSTSFGGSGSLSGGTSN